MRWIHKLRWRQGLFRGITNPYRHGRIPKIFYTIINMNSRLGYRLNLETSNTEAWRKRKSVPVFKYQMGSNH